MMKFAFVVLCIVACAAIAKEIPESMCSVSATGTVTITIGGMEWPYTGKMIRVGDTAKYEVYGQNHATLAAIYIRPDKAKTYVIHTTMGFMTFPSLNMSDYEYNSEKGCFAANVEGGSGEVYFDDSDKLTKENFTISHQTYKNITVTIEYGDDVNYDYTHDSADEEFSCVDIGPQCDDDSKTIATQAITSEVCGTSGSNSNSNSHSNSGSNSGHPSGSGSNSGHPSGSGSNSGHPSGSGSNSGHPSGSGSNSGHSSGSGSGSHGSKKSSSSERRSSASFTIPSVLLLVAVMLVLF